MSFRSLQTDREHSTENVQLHRQLCRQRSNSTPTLCNVASGDVNAKDSKGRTLLYYAAKYGQTEIARSLLDAGCDPNITDCNKSTALHEATDGSHLDVIKLLIKSECDLNIKNLQGQTALMRAVLFDDIATVKILHKAGANVDETDCTGKTALLIGLQEGREKSCVYLIKHGCEVNIVDKLGQTALYLATHTTVKCSPSVCKKLISAGYRLDNDSEWLPKDLLKGLTERGRNILGRFLNIFNKKKQPCNLEFVPEESDELEFPNFRILDICT
ncbi:uncharacterized protein LOC143059755 [Mytilus galloprovincialis]|uniref:Uncharacterized protein n=2 Tax=Mytilus TaxID=6548 RepID=A0A8B6FQX4_MYTGA|nr:unnamed protein product [Mytilus edulis]VDI53266.1 Hypothetical predicted protein [Mytilus galloprovincialis]